MKTQHTSTPQTHRPYSLGRYMLAGATIALVLIGVFLFPVDASKPEWGRLWMLRPLIMLPVAGAMGAAFCYLAAHLGRMAGLNKAVIIICSIIGYCIALWLGFVLGLDGTLWD